MSNREHSPNFDQPMMMQSPDANKIACKDCAFRDKTILEYNGKIIPVGITKSFCKIYEPPPKTNGKPSDVMFINAKCKYYHKEEPDD